MLTSQEKAPKWFTAIVIIAVLPIFQLPLLLSIASGDQQGIHTMIWIYPIYAIVAAYLAWQCYPQRRALAWILIALLLLSHLAIYTLANTTV